MSATQLTVLLADQSPSKTYAYLKKQSVESLAAVSDHDFLELLNPAIHSLQYLFILKSRLLRPAKTDTEGRLSQKISFFLERFDPQRVKVAASELHNLVCDFAALCDVRLNSPVLALASMKIAIHRYSKSASHLTSIHYLFIRQCLLARCYDEALGILNIVIDDLDLDTEPSYQHYLLYFYYGCMVYIAHKDFQRAHDFASLVVTAPGSACSAIQLEAYKKYILISVILNGNISSMPFTVSQAAARAFKHLARPYEEFAQALRKPDTVQDCLRTHEAVFAEDKNLGLVSQALERQEMRQIAALKETYVTISLEDIAAKLCGSKSNVSPDDVQRMESLILRMIEDKVLNARISDHPPVVTFSDDIEVPTRHQLETVLSLTSAINNKIKALDREVSLSTAYNSKQASKAAQGRMSPVEGEPEVNSRYSMRDQGKTGRGRKGSFTRGGNKFPVAHDEKMEE